MAETVYSGSVEPDQARTCEGNKQLICLFLPYSQQQFYSEWLRG